jgi:hypothetical protein
MLAAIWLAPLVAAATVDLTPMSSAELCGRCHRAIHEAWKTSSHARAMDSALFQDALELAQSESGASARRICLGCHSPLAIHAADASLQKKVSWEGVTCDWCHSVREVTLTAPNPRARVEFSLVKSGPLKDSESLAHGTVYSEVHTQSLVCAPCHEFRNALAFPVLTTFSEWKSSRYWKEGKQCQSCHMGRVAGSVVDPRVKRTMSKVNLHQMPGSHSIEQLTSTIKAQLGTVREGNRLRVTVDVSNVAAGHYVPTGSPLRKIVLDVRADSYRGQQFREERVYARRVADAQGNAIDREHAAFLRAAKVLTDTRLAPDEKRTETFLFDIPPGLQTKVQATLSYYYSPLAIAESQKRVTFLTLSRLVR